MYLSTDNQSNGLIAFISGFPGYIAALMTQDSLAVTAAIVLPICFFIIGKTVDVVVRIYLANRNKE